MSTALVSSRGAQHPRRWTPKELGTLSLWLDADDATTITILTGVSQWDDKSGNGRNVTQSTGANQPSRVVNGRSGRALLRFNGSSQFLEGGDVLDMLAGGLSVAAAFVPTSSSNGGVISKGSNSENVNGEWSLNYLRLRALMNAANSRDGAFATTTTAAQVVAGVIDRSAGIQGWRDGTAGTLVTTGFPVTTSYDTTHILRIGSDGGFGSSSGAAQSYLNGDIFEIVVSLATWTTTERQQVEGYLAHKWGTTGSLPSDHPYKSIAP